MSVKRPTFGILYIDIPLLVSATIFLLLTCSQIEIGEALESSNIFSISLLFVVLSFLFVMMILFRAFWPLLMRRDISLVLRLVFLFIYLGMSYIAFDCFFYYHPQASYFVETTWNWIRKFNFSLKPFDGNHVTCVDGRAAQILYSSREVGYCQSQIIYYRASEDSYCRDGNDKKTVKNLDYSWSEQDFSDGTASVLSCLIP